MHRVELKQLIEEVINEGSTNTSEKNWISGMRKVGDYLKSNCRSWEQDCNNENDTAELVSHLQNKFKNLTYDEAWEVASHWTGYEPDIDESLVEEIKPISQKPEGKKLVIDLTGPDGNAFVLLGYAKQLARQNNYDSDEISDLLKDMQSGDYENLLDVMEEHFGNLIVMYK